MQVLCPDSCKADVVTSSARLKGLSRPFSLPQETSPSPIDRRRHGARSLVHTRNHPMNRQSRSSFCLGSIVATKGALAACQNYSVSPWIYFGVMLRKIGATSASKTCRRIAKQSEVGSAYCLHIDFRHRSGFGSSPRLIEARQRFSCLRSTEQMPKTSAKRSRATAARDRTDERLQRP